MRTTQEIRKSSEGRAANQRHRSCLTIRLAGGGEALAPLGSWKKVWDEKKYFL